MFKVTSMPATLALPTIRRISKGEGINLCWLYQGKRTSKETPIMLFYMLVQVKERVRERDGESTKNVSIYF